MIILISEIRTGSWRRRRLSVGDDDVMADDSKYARAALVRKRFSDGAGQSPSVSVRCDETS